jgi:segregation and condensation protein A
MHTSEYRVRLDAFEGPLDLLLHLIGRAEIEVTDIPIAALTEQYLDYLGEGGVESIDIEKAGEFLVMAATLMEIKSRMLMPVTETESARGELGGAGDRDQGTDPRADLVRQLLAYKRFRDAAGRLQRQLQEWESRYPAAGAGIDRERMSEALSDAAGVDIEDVDVVDLVEAFGRIIAAVDLSRVGEHHVAMDDTPIEEHAEDIMGLLRDSRDGGRGDEVEFASVFARRTRGEMIGLFLAMLELVRQCRVVVKQDDAQGRIVLRLADETTDAPAGGTGEDVAGGPSAG